MEGQKEYLDKKRITGGCRRILLQNVGVEDLLGELQGVFMFTKPVAFSLEYIYPCLRLG